VYPRGYSTYVNVEGLSSKLEGVSRPGHFRGVCTVVTIFLNIIRPDFAFFGQKDAQQSLIVKRMVRDLAFETEVVILPTVREDSGLAMSSRNLYLNAEEHEAATVIHRALMKAREGYKAGERNAGKLAEIVRATIEGEPRARLDYVSVADAETLVKLDKLDEQPILIVVGTYIGKTRLIDNIVINGGASKNSSISAKA
jgi:pantoate--beta-alanine ligase